jgi:8-oxo-dGTP diphosphatase
MMTEHPASDKPPRRAGPGNPGDAWVTAPDGQRYWGRFGAAGLLAFDPGRGILLQHRASWSHHGDTWALPGGARHEGESALAAALRESAEEAGVPAAAIRPRLMSVLDLGVWSYATVIGDVVEPFEPVISDPESLALAWVPLEEVESLPLHPAFQSSWPELRPLLQVRPAVVVDAANVVGSVPDGWWKDRAGAAARLITAVSALAARGIPSAFLELPGDTAFPEYTVVLEGRARDVPAPEQPGVQKPPVTVLRAAGSGDDAIVTLTEQLASAGLTVTVATSDRELTDRSRRIGASVVGAGRLRELLGY